MDSKNKKKGIVLNRMYAGDYLSTNLGHEVINMFQADDEKHYLYLNAKGNFTKTGKNIETMLLVRGIGEGRVEVVGMAKNLNAIESACCTLPRDIGKINTKVREVQNDLLKNVTYDEVPIFDIFGTEGQQSVYASYWVEKDNFFIPKKRLIINFKNSTKKENTDITLNNHNFASYSLRQFILKGDDLQKLEELCNKGELWDVDNKKISNKNIAEERKISLFDICQIQNDENRFSNAISYFIQQYPGLWQKLLQELIGVQDLGEIVSVAREEDAKVDKIEYKDKTGGRIDLLLRTKKNYIIIENKIDSQIIEDNGVTQLSRYYHYVKYLKEEQIKGIQGQKDDVVNKGIIGLVLTPNYNMPGEKQLKVNDDFSFKTITYKGVCDWLGKNAENELDQDVNFKDFYNAMKRHTYKHKSETLYEDMLEKFVRRIKEAKASKVVSRTDPNNPNQGIVRPEDCQLPEGFEMPTGDLISEELGEAIRKSEGYQ